MNSLGCLNTGFPVSGAMWGVSREYGLAGGSVSIVSFRVYDPTLY